MLQNKYDAINKLRSDQDVAASLWNECEASKKSSCSEPNEDARMTTQFELAVFRHHAR